VSVVVPTRNRAPLLPDLIDALLGQSGVGALELVIVDDASSDDTPALLERLARNDERLIVKRLTENAGPAVARNLGWRSARGDVIAFTDDDCVPQDGWLAALLAAHVLGADVVQGTTFADIESHGDRGTFSRWIEVFEFSHLYQTCNMSYRRSLLVELGGFDESFGTSRGGAPNGEDADLGWRAAERGARCTFTAEARVQHPVSPSSLTLALRSRLRSYRMVYFVRRHPGFRAHSPRRYFFHPAHPAALLSLLSWVPFMVSRRPVFALVGVVGALPYVRTRSGPTRLPGRRRYLPLIVMGAWVIDVTEIGIMAAGSVRWRHLYL
jgi:glycosyltransferase involved in cell wall biosynthesis